MTSKLDIRCDLLQVFAEVDNLGEQDLHLDDLVYLYNAIGALVDGMRDVGVEKNIWRPFDCLKDAISSLCAHQQPEMLTARQRSNSNLSPAYAEGMAYGSLAITSATKNNRHDVCYKAAKILGVNTNQLWNFRKQLMRGLQGKHTSKMKSLLAHMTYQMGLQNRYPVRKFMERPSGKMMDTFASYGSPVIIDAPMAKNIIDIFTNGDAITTDDWIDMIDPVESRNIRKG